MKRSDVFEVREPPPHGWTRLKARLEDRRPVRWRWAVLAAGAIAGVLFLSVPRPSRIDPALQEAALAALEGRAPVAREPMTWVGDARGAVLRVPSQDPQIVMYRVAMLSADEAPPTE